MTIERNHTQAPASDRTRSSDFAPVGGRAATGLAGKVALVTGSSRGIGAAIARCFAAEGARVALHGRDEAALALVRAQIETAGGHAVHATADVTRFDEIERMRAQIERELGPVEVLVANAGGNAERTGPIEDIAEEAWRASLEVNLTATFLTLKCFLPGMKERHRGIIVTVSSAAARRPHPRSPAGYAAAKAGIELLTQDVAMQVGPFGIRVNCVAPETILTERNRERIPDEQKAMLVDLHPIRRLGTPEDVAHAALFLATEHSDWVTGVVLDVAGGAVMVR